MINTRFPKIEVLNQDKLKFWTERNAITMLQSSLTKKPLARYSVIDKMHHRSYGFPWHYINEPNKITLVMSKTDHTPLVIASI
jgi:hypothetical protein